MINAFILILSLLALVLLFFLVRNNKRQRDIIRKESEQINLIRKKQDSFFE